MRSIQVLKNIYWQKEIFSLSKVGSIRDITICKHPKIYFFAMGVPGRVPRHPIFQTDPAKKTLILAIFQAAEYQ